MNARIHVPLRVAAVSAASLLVAMTAAAPASAAEGDVQVVNTETVQVYTDATGKVQTKRVYEQIEATGKGTVDLVNPIETDGLRNLDGFGGFEVKDGQQVAEMTVDGKERLRTVSNFTGDLPLELSVEYTLDGKRVDPEDVVGKTGTLEVKYVAKNITSQPQELTFDDGKGGTVTKTVDVPIPLVGSLTVTAPSNFTNVQSDQANKAGDGKGGTKLSFTITLFPPVGSDTAEFGYTAEISDGVVPRTSVTVLPVNPLDVPSFASAAESYKGGADTGIELTAGASEIDANLLKLRDGAGQLLAGLIQLRDGAVELEAGLAGSAAPGAQKLAAGAAELNGGLGQIDDGAGKLADGSGRLAAGTGDAYTGSKKLSDGLGQISGGLGQLADAQTGLPAAKDGIAQLKAGVDLMIQRVGTVNNAETLIGGLAALETGLGAAVDGAGQIHGGLQLMVQPNKLPAAQAGAEAIRDGIAPSTAPGGKLDTLKFTLSRVKADACDPDDLISGLAAIDLPCGTVLDQMMLGVDESKASLQDAQDGADAIATGLTEALNGLNGLLIPGAGELATKLGTAEAGSTKLKNGAIELKGGLRQVSAGLTDLSKGITKAVSGVLQLNSGAQEAYAGSGDLTDGLGQLRAGAQELNSGAGQLADGTGKAADGAYQLSDGANQLADGLGDAAGGSGQLADGLKKAAGSAPQLEDGAQRLSDEGTSKLVDAGQATAQNYGEMYATIQAGAERADNERMQYGAPEGAVGLAAYSYEIKGEDGEGGRNVARGLGGLAVLAAGAGALLFRRRII